MKSKFIVAVYAVLCLSHCKTTTNTSDLVVRLPQELSSVTDSQFDSAMKIIGKPKIIATSEAYHGFSEPLEFRNQLLKYLVKKQLVDVVVIESGMAESRALYDYVLGASASADSVMNHGFTWGFEALPQNKELIEWLRAYNQNTVPDKKVKLYGFDMAGSPGLPNGRMKKILLDVVDRLKKIDGEEYKSLSSSLMFYVQYLHVNLGARDSLKAYTDLTPTQKSDFGMLVRKNTEIFLRDSERLKAKLGEEGYQWSLASIEALQQTINWFNIIPANYSAPPDYDEWGLQNELLINKLQGYRDSAMFDNLKWIMKRHSNSKLLLFASRYHCFKIPLTIKIDSSHQITQPVLGNHLFRHLGNGYKVIGHFAHESITPNDTITADNAFENILYKQDSTNRLQSAATFKSLQYKLMVLEPTGQYVDISKALDVIFFASQQRYFTVR